MLIKLSGKLIHVSSFRFFLIALLTFFGSQSFGQILIGPVVGVHSSWPVFKDKEIKEFIKPQPFVGYNVGASLSFRVQKKFFLQTSIMYTRKGKDLDGIKDDLDFSNKSKYNYLEMPILYTIEFKGKLGKKGNKEFKWYLGGGPTVSYWMGGKGVLKDGDLVESNVSSLPYKITFNQESADVKKGEMNVDDGNRIQLALNLSAGLILEPVGFNKIMIAMRYEFGHSYLSRTTDGYFGGYDNELFYEDELQVRMQTLNLSLHYFIDLKTDQRKKGKSTIKTKKGKLRR